MGYLPKPADLSGVAVPEAVVRALETIAENTHDVWAKGRMAEGWTYGAELNRALKTHPSLVPYAELPESEKEYDRATSLETIKMLLRMGYTIEKRQA